MADVATAPFAERLNFDPEPAGLAAPGLRALEKIAAAALARPEELRR
jgi:hypothetical protein